MACPSKVLPMCGFVIFQHVPRNCQTKKTDIQKQNTTIANTTNNIGIVLRHYILYARHVNVWVQIKKEHDNSNKPTTNKTRTASPTSPEHKANFANK